MYKTPCSLFNLAALTNTGIVKVQVPAPSKHPLLCLTNLMPLPWSYYLNDPPLGLIFPFTTLQLLPASHSNSPANLGVLTLHPESSVFNQHNCRLGSTLRPRPTRHRLAGPFTCNHPQPAPHPCSNSYITLLNHRQLESHLPDFDKGS